MTTSTALERRPRGRPQRTFRSAADLLNRSAILSLTDVATILGMDRSTLLRKERDGLLPKRRDVAGRLVFLASEIRDFLAKAPIVDGPDADRSERSRKAQEIARAKKAGRAA